MLNLGYHQVQCKDYIHQISSKDNMSNYPCSAVFLLDQSLSYPHYSDDRWKDTLTIYGHKPSESANDIHWQYDDRLRYDREKHSRGSEKAKLQKDNTGRYWLEYLKGYYDSDIELIWIGAGSNWSSGYPYWVFAFRILDKEKV